MTLDNKLAKMNQDLIDLVKETKSDSDLKNILLNLISQISHISDQSTLKFSYFLEKKEMTTEQKEMTTEQKEEGKSLIKNPEKEFINQVIENINKTLWDFRKLAESNGVVIDKDVSSQIAYANALNVLLELRMCEGSEPARDGGQCHLRVYDNGDLGLSLNNHFKSIKMSYISPCFKTREHAEAAIQKVGKERIFNMFKTLHGVE